MSILFPRSKMGIPSPAASWRKRSASDHLTATPTQIFKRRDQRSYLDVGEPGFDGPEALLDCDVVHHHHAVRLAKELLGDAAVPAATTASVSNCTCVIQVTLAPGFQRTSPDLPCPTAAWPPACCPASVSSHCNQYLIRVDIIKQQSLASSCVVFIFYRTITKPPLEGEVVAAVDLKSKLNVRKRSKQRDQFNKVT